MTGDSRQSPEFVLYSRAECHLCDVMLQELHTLLDGLEFKLSVIDISLSDDLISRYAERIPVLTVDGVELCHYRLDVQRVRDWLAA